MSANWRTRCDWCGWPMVPHPEPGCWDGNCSMRPMKELTPAQAQVVELKQEIRKLERHQVNHSALPYKAMRKAFVRFIDNLPAGYPGPINPAGTWFDAFAAGAKWWHAAGNKPETSNG